MNTDPLLVSPVASYNSLRRGDGASPIRNLAVYASRPDFEDVKEVYCAERLRTSLTVSQLVSLRRVWSSDR